jgi:non-ribosomal peptide synthetase component E (peptide arylation enzyme)
MFESIIAHHARLEPDAPAIVMADYTFSYGRMAADIARCAHWLAGLNLSKGKRALLHLPHPYVHWIVTYGLEHHGVVTASSPNARNLRGEIDFIGADLLFTSAPIT